VNLRTLIIAPNLPHPVRCGVDLRNWQNVNALKKLGSVGVFGLCVRDPSLSRVRAPDLEFYRVSSDPAITYPPPPGHKGAATRWLEDPLGHPNDFYFSEIACAELRFILKDFRPQLVLLEGLFTHRYIPLIKAHPCKIVLDLHDALAPLTQQLGTLITENDLAAKLACTVLPERIRLIEQRAANAVDQLWICSQREAELISTLYHPTIPVHVVPNTVNTSYYTECANQCSPVHRSKSVIFPAMFAYPPNKVAATFLMKAIFPRLAGLTEDIRLVLAGSPPTAQMIEAAALEPRIVVTGPVRDMRPHLQAASAMIVPLFHGSGTRLKILEAFAAALPVVSTTKGAEGLEVENEKHLLLAESADEFVCAVERIWNDVALVKRLTANGLELVTNKYSWEVAERDIRSAVKELMIAP
jgi:polysaccharide biosynthesis protein PslH